MFRRLLIATVVGILAAFAVAGFRHAMLLLEWLFLNNDSGSLVNAATNLSPWRRLLTPALGGLAAGLLLMGWQKFTQQRPHAPTDYMEALQTDGQFDYAASLVKSLASLLVVTSGSAIGREGAMILLAALAASCFAQRFTPRQEWKLWIACGAAAGMAAAYRAPLAGSLFIAEVLFGTMMLASLGPVIISAVVALLVSNLINHSDALLYSVQLSVTVQARDYALIYQYRCAGRSVRTTVVNVNERLSSWICKSQTCAALATGTGRVDRGSAFPVHTCSVGQRL